MLIKSRRYHGDFNLALHPRIDDCTENNIGVVVRSLMDNRRCFIDFTNGQVVASSDVNDDTARSLNSRIFQQGTGNCPIRCGVRSARPFANSGAHNGHAGPRHDTSHVSEVEVDHAGH